MLSCCCFSYPACAPNGTNACSCNPIYPLKPQWFSTPLSNGCSSVPELGSPARGQTQHHRNLAPGNAGSEKPADKTPLKRVAGVSQGPPRGGLKAFRACRENPTSAHFRGGAASPMHEPLGGHRGKHSPCHPKKCLPAPQGPLSQNATGPRWGHRKKGATVFTFPPHAVGPTLAPISPSTADTISSTGLPNHHQKEKGTQSPKQKKN